MSEHKPQRCLKVKYRSLKDAERARQIVMFRVGNGLWIYRCGKHVKKPVFHLTSKPPHKGKKFGWNYEG